MKNTKKLFTIHYSLFTIFLLLLFGCKEQTYDLSGLGGSGDSSLGNMFTEKTEVEKLSAPAQLFVSEGLYSDQIRISWSKVDGATSYRLERAVKSIDDTTEPEDDEYSVILASNSNIAGSTYVNSTSFVDTILENPTYNADEYRNVYYYRVSAENVSDGYESSDFLSETEPGKKAKGFLFAPPASVSASAGESQEKITITWAKTPQAKSYNIYRSTDEEGATSALIASVTSDRTRFENKINAKDQGVDFYYTVEAVNRIKEKTVKSSSALGFALKEGAPGRVQNVKVTKGRGEGGEIEITWDEVPPGPSETMLYKVFCITDGAMSQVASGLTVNKFMERRALKPNLNYYYRVLAYKIDAATEEEIKGPLSDSGPEDGTPAEAFILSPPPEVAVIKDGSKLKMQFKKPIGEKGSNYNSGFYEDFKDYNFEIYGANDMDFTTGTLVWSISNGNGGYEDTYTILNLKVHKYYRVVTIFGSEKSAYSTIVAPAPSAAQNTLVSCAAFIPGYTEPDYDYSKAGQASSEKNKFNQNEVYPVILKWDVPSDGADGGYHIYRSDKIDSGFRKITDAPISELWYIDENSAAKAGKIYYYKVLSLNSLGQGANYSEIKAPKLGSNNMIELKVANINLCENINCGTGFGWGAITHNQYMREYNKTIQSSQKKLTLMYKKPDTEKLGKETINGDVCGTLTYNAQMDGLGADIKMPYSNYADHYVDKNPSLGIYFMINGSTNTKSNMSANGHMYDSVNAVGMYPGKIVYDNVEIKGGKAGGGYYTITPVGFTAVKVDYTVGNEGW